ncbi:MAG: hypothetical protein HeimC3_36780 [Candidatus Heimdallarchaeota archaeon LC_3]|nr:MAG: hypothetical protein HeimC3_36780 [Candidatus Heimdallarchaeota archaeon LC_3]
MSDSNQKCTYHPVKDMVTYCTRCRRSICYSDLRKYDKLNARGEILTETNPKDYCLICFSIKLSLDLEKYSQSYIRWSIVVVITFVIISLIYSPLFFIVLLIVMSIFYWEYKQIPSKKDKPLEEAHYLINSLENNQILILSKEDSLECFECKTKIEKNDKFCPNCGDSTIEEFLFIDP